MFIIRNKMFFITISAVLVAASLASVLIFGFNLGIDFTGGSLMEMSYPEGRPDARDVEARLEKLGLDEFLLQPVDEDGYILRTRTIEKDERDNILNALTIDGNKAAVEERFTSIGPTIGEELKKKSFFAIGVVLAMIILFVAWAFRKVSKIDTLRRRRREQEHNEKVVSSWKYGIVAVIALFHDIAIPTGVFVLFGVFAGAEIDVLFVTALLAILGYSVNDTIVVFDRVRENIFKNQESGLMKDFGETVGKSLEQTYIRSINTSLTTAFVLVALLVLGSASTRYFSLVLLIGVVAGTYSSIFLASPLLVFLSSKKR